MSGTISTRWFFSDWISDTGIRASSLAARGLWKDLLCIAGANRGKDHGFVLINGRIPTFEQIARQVGAPSNEVENLIAELELNGVFSRDRRGAMYCRRMVRAEKNRGNGKLGGNPNFKKNKDNQKSVREPPKAPIPEPEPEPSPKEKEPALALTGGADVPPDGWPADAWDKFYRKYPHKVGVADARKAFNRVRAKRIVSFPELMAGLVAYVGKTDDRPWCNPSTWLNQHRWQDQPAVNGGRNGTDRQNPTAGTRQRGGGGFAAYAVARARSSGGEGSSGASGPV